MAGIADRLNQVNFDDFVKSPISALRFISLPLRRTLSTPRGASFTRLELGAFYEAIGWKII